MKIAIDTKIEIALDCFGWTPFHYLLHSDHSVEPQTINHLLYSFLKNPEELIFENNLDPILDSIMKDLPLILEKRIPHL